MRGKSPDGASHGWLRAAAAGIAAGAVFVAVSGLVALLVEPAAAPWTAVGSFVIDIVPTWAREVVIGTFGFGDKLFLGVALVVAALVVAVAAGVLERARRPAGAVLIGVAGVAVIVASITRADASPWAVLPPALGTAAGVAVLRVLTMPVPATAPPPGSTGGGAHAVLSVASAGPQHPVPVADRLSSGRRGFLITAGVGVVALIVAGAVSRAGRAAASSVARARDALHLPHPRHTVTVPAGAELHAPGVPPLFTPNADFYRVDTALSIPTVDPSTWQLTVDGMVDRVVRLSFDELLAMGPDEYVVTLTCVSNPVGGDLVGNARWLGVPVRDLLARAAPHADADMVLSRSVDGFTAGTPLAALTDPHRDAILAVGMNGRPLPFAHGFPVRMIVPGLYGYVSATKWLQRLTVTTFATSTAYWTSRGYSAEAPIKMSSRIDTPRAGAAVHAGRVVVGGVAWAQPVGVGRVELRVDDRPWRPARMSTPVNGSTWVQWVADWDAAPGNHTLTVRAVDIHGRVQDGTPRDVVPNGATGWDALVVQVS